MHVTKKKIDTDELTQLYVQLSIQQQDNLLSFARFLVHDDAANLTLMTAEKPQLQPRPDSESVIAAIKRLSTDYAMLKKETLFGYTSDLITAHMLQGREAKVVIDDLEDFFIQTYQDYCQQFTE